MADSFAKVVGGKLALKSRATAPNPPSAAPSALHGRDGPSLARFGVSAGHAVGSKRPRPEDVSAAPAPVAVPARIAAPATMSGVGPSGSGGAGSAGGGGGGGVAVAAAAADVGPTYTPPQRLLGSGRITVSGTAVEGVDTKFKAECTVGDAIEVTNPATGAAEVRVIKLLLSDVAAGINAPFPPGVGVECTYHILQLPRLIESEAMKREAAAKRRREEEEGAYGALASDGGRVFTYHEKKGSAYGGYRVVKVALDGERSREELLNMRAKAKSDKYC